MVKAKVGPVLSARTSLSQAFRGANETGKGLNSAKHADGSLIKLHSLPHSNPINETFNFTSLLWRLLNALLAAPLTSLSFSFYLCLWRVCSCRQRERRASVCDRAVESVGQGTWATAPKLWSLPSRLADTLLMGNTRAKKPPRISLPIWQQPQTHTHTPLTCLHTCTDNKKHLKCRNMGDGVRYHNTEDNLFVVLM